MEQTPDTHVQSVERVKPRLLICDDDPQLLVRFAAQYRARGYDVVPVLVSDGYHDQLMKDGRIKQGEMPSDDPLSEPAHRDPQSTVADQLVHARNVAKYNANDKYAEEVARFEAMQQIERGVTSKTQLRAIMQEVKPDFVLSDREMRRPMDPDMPAAQQAVEDDVILGDHVMAMVAALLPNVPHAIHTGQYTVSHSMRKNCTPEQLEKQRALRREWCGWENEKLGVNSPYRVFPKDEPDTHSTCDAVDAYFRTGAGLSRG